MARRYEPDARAVYLLPAHGKRNGCWSDYHATLDGTFW